MTVKRLGVWHGGELVAELESIDHLLLGEPVRGACVAQHPAEVLTGTNPIVLCAHIDTDYPERKMCQ